MLVVRGRSTGVLLALAERGRSTGVLLARTLAINPCDPCVAVVPLKLALKALRQVPSERLTYTDDTDHTDCTVTTRIVLVGRPASQK